MTSYYGPIGDWPDDDEVAYRRAQQEEDDALFAAEAAAMEAAERREQAEREAAGLCIGCGKPGTMWASLGLTCADCYDEYS